MWLEARFRPRGGGRWYPDAWRAFCAKTLAGAGAESTGEDKEDKPNEHRRLFWRDEAGRPLGGKPRITFVGSAQWCGIRVVGQPQAAKQFHQDCVAVLRGAIPIAEALDAKYGGQHAPDILEGARDIEAGHTRYHIRKMGLPRNYCRRQKETLLGLIGKGKQASGEAWAQLLEEAKAVILDGIREELPQASIWGLEWVDEPRLSTPVSVRGELVFCLTDLCFKLPQRIKGPVQVGSLQSWGYGDIRIIPPGGRS